MNGRLATPSQRMRFFQRLLHRLCTRYGPHPSGTRAFLKVIRALHRELDAAVPTAFLDRYLDFWQALPGTQILHCGKPLQAVAAENSAGTEEEGFTGILHRVEGPTARYHILRMEGDAPGAGAAPENRQENPEAVVVASRDVAPVPEYLIDEEILSVPRFVLGLRDVPLADLLAQHQEPVQVRLREVHAPRLPTYNAVGRIPGSRPEEEILLIAHADSVIETQGANDNTATAIIAVMLAHALGGRRLRRPITFLLTGSEEYGCRGAHHYVRRRQVEGTEHRIRFVLNCDSLTYGPNLWTTTDDAELAASIRQIQTELTPDTHPLFTLDAEPWMNDARPFRGIDPRVRGVNFNSRGCETLAANHTPADTAQNVPLECVEPAFLVLRELLLRLQEL